MRALALLLLLFTAFGAGIPTYTPRERDLPGTFVVFDKLSECPKLAPRPPSQTVDDVRPDDFTILMAIGDSITAALLARDSPTPGGVGGNLPRDGALGNPPAAAEAQDRRTAQALLPSSPWPPPTDTIEEWRGVSYSIGGDDGAVTLPNILAHYTETVGHSVGHHPILCVGGESGACHPPEDGLNSAVSGSISASLWGQVYDHIVPRYLELPSSDREGWTYANLAIGANDICAFCLSSNIPLAPGTPEEFAQGIYAAVELLRRHVPRLVVNIVGLFRVSAVYNMTLNDPYCQGPFHPPVPHLPLECSCATLPGPVGDYTRRRMDELGDAYDAAVHGLIKRWDAEGNSTFAAIWQPGSAVDLGHYPIAALSRVDCFHPSEEAHKRLAAGLWNRLTLPQAYKAIPFAWEDDVWVRCLEPDDRIQVRQPL